MFRFRRPKLQLLTDWHSHILPGVDDGIADVDTSLAVLGAYEQLGIRRVWLTPHVMEDAPNTPARLRSVFDELRGRYTGPVKLSLAAENMIDELFYRRLQAGDILPIGERGEMLLVETTTFYPPLGLEDTLRDILHRGYYPLLAHPERYRYLRTVDDYRRLKELGVRLQLNLLSLDGMYGPEVRQKARALLRAGLYDHYGTDLHRPEQARRIAAVLRKA